jgi:hypothetical protein
MVFRNRGSLGEMKNTKGAINMDESSILSFS